MSTIIKNGVEITMPDMDKTTELNMERCADFMAKMIRKYGTDVIAKNDKMDNKCRNHK